MDKQDTSPDAMKVIDDIYRNMSYAEKWRLIFDAYRTGQALSMAGIRMQHSDWNEQQRQLDDIRGILGTQRDSLDLAYLKKWASVLEVADVLENMLKEQM